MPTVYAHPGRTGGNGGHTNHSTGEYHYHHGYSAHGHYDIDGDGVVDCPYDFDDKTNHNSSSDYSYVRPTEESEASAEVAEETESEDDISEYQRRFEKQTKRKKASEVLKIVASIGAIPLSWLVFYLFIRFT